MFSFPMRHILPLWVRSDLINKSLGHGLMVGISSFSYSCRSGRDVECEYTGDLWDLHFV